MKSFIVETALDIILPREMEIKTGQQIQIGVNDDGKHFLYHVSGTYEIPERAIGKVVYTICLN
jgi:hypothetical protein